MRSLLELKALDRGGSKSIDLCHDNQNRMMGAIKVLTSEHICWILGGLSLSPHES